MYHDSYQVYGLLDKWNARGPPDPFQVQMLFGRRPAMARQVFLSGQTLLHKCMEQYGDFLELAVTLANAHPASVSMADDNGFLPLHRALLPETGKTSLEMVQWMIRQSPEIIFEQTASGALPLHLACATQDETAGPIVKYLANLFPEATRHRDNQGKFPLDYALQNSRPSAEVIEFLTALYPDPLGHMDDSGSTRLHRILKRQDSRCDKIVDVMVKANPMTLHLQDWNTGQTPLLQACEDDNCLSQLYSMVKAWPELVTLSSVSNLLTVDSFNGEMQPSALASKAATIDRLKEWIAVHPSCITIVDQQGRLPLHYAAMSPSSEASAMVVYLTNLDASATGVRMADCHGRLPIHYAAAGATDIQTIEVLIDAFREGLMHADKEGRLPWHYAECARQDMVYDRTLEYFPHIDSGSLHLIPEEIRWDMIEVAHSE